MSQLDHLLALYARTFGAPPAHTSALRADGSNRQLWRLHAEDGTRYVGVYGPDAKENRAFLRFSEAFRVANLPVPRIYAADEARGIYIEEDLGDTTLYDALTAQREAAGGAFPESMLPVYRRVTEVLPRIQIEGGRVADYSVAYPRAEFDRRSIAWDLSYFKYLFLKLVHVEFDEERLENDFDTLTAWLLEAERDHFLYRDFQSRNIMLRGDDPTSTEPWFIDYQGGRRGALQYDVASLLYDAKADLPERVREELLDHYLTALAAFVPVDGAEFKRFFRGFALLRILQALGAYGYRGLYERKAHFIASIPYAVRNAGAILADDFPIALGELPAIFERLREIFAERIESRPETPARLRVTITSFSYKRGGYPSDESEHGGGFVFDCRAIHNPGRYEDYVALSGLDIPVVEFLERREEVESFWQSVRGLVDAAVTRYLERGFDHLGVSFGCTGGQHRSVYFAERLARHLREAFPQAEVAIEHREKEGWKRGV